MVHRLYLGGLVEEETFANGSRQLENMCPMGSSFLSSGTDLRTLVGRCDLTGQSTYRKSSTIAF